LTVTVRVPDGIVIATDSLASLTKAVRPQAQIAGKCPKCKEEIKITDLTLPPINIPSGGSSYAQKLFKIGKRNIGIAVYGTSFLDGRTVESHIREFEKSKITGEETVEEVANKLRDYFYALVKKVVKDMSKIAEDVHVIGFQVAGYDKEDTKIGRTYKITVGREAKIEPIHTIGYGATTGGDGRVVAKLWKRDPAIPIAKPIYKFLTLQDAIDYAIFLIRTTIDYQRFASMAPVVGGDIDVAIITHHDGFKWIQHKEYVGEKRV
jgi:20S proteasome alpha/beta subunit